MKIRNNIYVYKKFITSLSKHLDIGCCTAFSLNGTEFVKKNRVAPNNVIQNGYAKRTLTAMQRNTFNFLPTLYSLRKNEPRFLVNALSVNPNMQSISILVVCFVSDTFFFFDWYPALTQYLSAENVPCRCKSSTSWLRTPFGTSSSQCLHQPIR